MTSGLTSRLIHTCTIKRKTATGKTDELGNPITTETTQTGINCRFSYTNLQQGIQTQGVEGAGRFILKIPMAFFEAGTDVQEEDLIITEAEGWAGKNYEVSNVTKIPEFNSSTIDHIEVQLSSLEKKEAE